MAESLPDYTVMQSPYPARTNSSSTCINGVDTIATAVYFSDKILITVTQNGRLAHWVHVPLDITATDASLTSTLYTDQNDDQVPNSDLLPMHHLTGTTILGGTIPEVEVLGQTLATQIASAIKTRDAREGRMVVVGMGLERGMRGREAFGEVVGLVLGVL